MLLSTLGSSSVRFGLSPLNWLFQIIASLVLPEDYIELLRTLCVRDISLPTPKFRTVHPIRPTVVSQSYAFTSAYAVLHPADTILLSTYGTYMYPKIHKSSAAIAINLYWLIFWIYDGNLVVYIKFLCPVNYTQYSIGICIRWCHMNHKYCTVLFGAYFTFLFNQENIHQSLSSNNCVRLYFISAVSAWHVWGNAKSQQYCRLLDWGFYGIDRDANENRFSKIWFPKTSGAGPKIWRIKEYEEFYAGAPCSSPHIEKNSNLLSSLDATRGLFPLSVI